MIQILLNQNGVTNYMPRWRSLGFTVGVLYRKE